MQHRVDVHVWNIDPARAPSADAIALLSDDERARMERFVFAEDQRRFAHAHARLRELLGQHMGEPPSALRFDYNDHRKPYIAGARRPFFNLTHSHDVAALAICDSIELGVDVERERPLKEDVAGRFFSRAECDVLRALPESEQQAAFYRCWTRKEAYVKAQGQGLAIPLDAFDVTMTKDARAQFLRIDGDDAEAWRLWAFEPALGYQGAVALRAARAEISFNLMTSA
jgi:4'-phosphopantetheinyl transferase